MVPLVKKVFRVTTFVLSLIPVSAAGDNLTHQDVLLAYVDVWNTGDVGRLDQLVTPGFQRHAGPDESCRSLAELELLISDTHEIWKIVRISIDDSMITEAGGAFRGGFYGVHRKTSGIIEFPTMSMVRFENGKIAEEWIIGDNFLSLMALGYELVPPGFEIVPADDTALPGSPAQEDNE